MNLSQGKNDNGSGSQLQQIMTLLEEIPFFNGFPVQSLKLVSYLCETGDYDDGDILVEAGDDPGLAIYVISGEVHLYPGNEGRRSGSYSEGAFFGGLSLLGSLPSLFTIKAVGKTKILLFERDRFATVLEQFPELHTVLFANLLKELRNWDQSLIEAGEGEKVPAVGVTLL